MNWSIYNNREVTIILWSDGTRNVFYSGDEHVDEFILRKKRFEPLLTYQTEKCRQSEYDAKYNSWSPQNGEK